MKYIAITLVIALLAAVGGVGYLYLTANVVVDAVSVTATEASAAPDHFDALSALMEEGAMTGTVFSDKPLESAEHYQFLTYTVRLKNDAYLPAEMVELQITPMDGDVVQLPTSGTPAIAKRSDGQVQATILTDIHSHTVREINISYYMWGFPFTLRTTYSR